MKHLPISVFVVLLLALSLATSIAEASHRHHRHRHRKQPFQCFACYGLKNCDRGGEQWDCAASERDMRPACKTEFKHIGGRKRVLERSCVDMPHERKHNFCTSLNDGYTRECYCFKPLCNDMLDYYSKAPRAATTLMTPWRLLALVIAVLGYTMFSGRLVVQRL